MNNLINFSIASLIWGSTWLAIKYQLGVVDPVVSIFYRFLLAGLLLLAFLYSKRLNMRYTASEHGWMALQGLLLFGGNYWLVYVAEQYLTSGIVAIVFTSIIFLNIINNAIFLRNPIRKSVVLYAIIGFLGVFAIFKNEVVGLADNPDGLYALGLAQLSAVIASLGNITSARNQKKGIPVLQGNAYGMIYGSLWMLMLSLVMQKPFAIDLELSYLLSLAYLAVFGSIIAFTSYLKLLGSIGPDKAAYVTLIIPIIALVLSTFFEGYQWHLWAILGVILVTISNIFILRSERKIEAKKK